MVLENDAAGRQKGKKGDEYDSHEGDERNPIDSPVICVHHVGFARMQAVSTRLLAILQVFAAADPDEGGNPAKFESVVMGSLPSRQRLSRCHVFPDANTQLRRKQHQENEGAGEGYRGNGPYSFGILPTTGAKPLQRPSCDPDETCDGSHEQDKHKEYACTEICNHCEHRSDYPQMRLEVIPAASEPSRLFEQHKPSLW